MIIAAAGAVQPVCQWQPGSPAFVAAAEERAGLCRFSIGSGQNPFPVTFPGAGHLVPGQRGTHGIPANESSIPRGVDQRQDEIGCGPAGLPAERVAGDQKSVPPVGDDLRVGPHRAGQDDAAGAHAFDERQSEGLLPVLEIDTEAAALHFTRQLALPEGPVERDPRLGLRIFSRFSPQPGAAIDVQVEARVGLPQRAQDGDGGLQALGGVAGIQEGERAAQRGLMSSSGIICLRYAMLADKNFVRSYTPTSDRLAADKIAGRIDEIKGVGRQAAGTSDAMDEQDLQPVFQLNGAQGSQIELTAAGGGDENIRAIPLQGRKMARLDAFFRPFLRAINEQSHPVPARGQGISHPGANCGPAPDPLLIQAGAVVDQVAVRTVDRDRAPRSCVIHEIRKRKPLG